MRIHVASIVKQMSPEVREAAEKEAASRGLSLEKFIEDQLAVEISETDFRSGAATIKQDIRLDRIRIRADHTDGGTGGGRTRVGGDVTIRIR